MSQLSKQEATRVVADRSTGQAWWAALIFLLALTLQVVLQFV